MKLSAIAASLVCGMFVASAVTAADGEAEVESQSADCSKLVAGPDVTVGEILRAGCEPTTAQMSALMDNPVGNVAMW